MKPSFYFFYIIISFRNVIFVHLYCNIDSSLLLIILLRMFYLFVIFFQVSTLFSKKDIMTFNNIMMY